MNDVLARRYTAAWSETDVLKDDTVVEVRLVRPEDKRLLEQGLERMSAESRFFRFFAHRDRLSPRELAYLTELDYERHLAIGAIGTKLDGEKVGLGVARFICLEPPTIAEAAITVIDEAQGKGLGRVLFKHLVAAAHERGVRAFRFDVLAENEAMLKLVEHLFPGSMSSLADGIVTIDCPLPAEGMAVDETADAMLYRVLRLAAEGALRVYRSLRSESAARLLKSQSGEPPLDFGLTEDDGPGPASG